MAEQKFTTGDVSDDVNALIGRFSTIKELAETIADKTYEGATAELACAICDVARVGGLIGEEIDRYSNRDDSSDEVPKSGEVEQREVA